MTRAGPEFEVASTQALTTQPAALFALAATLAKQRGRLDPVGEVSLLDDHGCCRWRFSMF